MTEEHSSRERRRTLVYWSKRQISKECIKLDPHQPDMAIVAHLWSNFGKIHLALQLRVQLWLRKKINCPKNICLLLCDTAVHLCASPPFFYWVSIQSAKQAKALFYLHKQSPPCFLGQRQLNLSCVVIAWFSLSSWLLACWETMSPGEKQQIVGMQLNETNYYMLTAFTMARLKALSSFNWPPRDSLSKKLDPFDCLYFWVFFFACREWESVREGPWLFDDFSYF